MALPHSSSTLVLVDGRSGSGKTLFATELAAERGATLISIDDVYPGWDGLDAGSWHIYHNVVLPISRGEAARYQRWDWEQSQPADWVTIPQGVAVVVEGCGAIRQESAPLAAERIWLEAPEEIRLKRALARDGDAYAALWRRWAIQEERFLALHNSVELATELYYTG
jgi:uridine kinase